AALATAALLHGPSRATASGFAPPPGDVRCGVREGDRGLRVDSLTDSLETEHLLLHWTTDSASVNSPPAEYVQSAAAYWEQAWETEDHDPRFELPPAVGAGRIGAAGNRLVNVYVQALFGASGLATPLDPIPGRCPGATSGRIRIESNLSDLALQRVCA